ncbi:MAG: (5-formylfuran-3-yl)methyl phosphate synthase [Planctomycetaceae bacterium]
MPLPSLLVSVRNAREANALRGSTCAIVDVKEPSRGALGMADRTEIHDISKAICEHQTMSVALGEVSDQGDCPALPQRVSFAKLGMSGLIGTDWKERWLSSRDRLANQSISWVAVIYADHKAARSPDPEAVVEAAAQTGCAVVLADTFAKSPGTSVFDSMSVLELASLRDQTNAAGMQFALAGQLRVHHASQIAEVAPDIVGIRGAACRAGDRQSELDAALVDEFAAAIATNPVST